MKNDIAVSIEHLSKFYKLYQSPLDRLKELVHPFRKNYHTKFRALHDITFDVPRGSIFAIVGQNGSGKSTLLQIISGIIRPTSGRIYINGRVSALLELGAGFHHEFTGRENVFMQGALMGIDRKDMHNHFDRIASFADIGDFLDQPVKTYSSGMFVRLAFATAINVNPDILIIDEVLAVGDDMFRRRCFNKIEEFKENGKTILFVSHNLESVTSICNHAILLDKGAILDIGPPKTIANIYSKLLSDREEHYLKYISTNKNTDNIPVDKDEKSAANAGAEFRYGIGGAELIDIGIFNHKSERVNIIEHGENFTVRLQVLFKKKMIDPMIGFRIRTLTGVDVTGTNTIQSQTPVGTVEEGLCVTMEFTQKMRINHGTYTLTSGVAEEVSKHMLFHDRRMDVIVFKVIGTSHSGGLVDMDSSVNFSIEQNKTANP